MSAVTTTALDLITGALRQINAYEAGETLNTNDANDALQVLNDLLESWTTEHLMVYSSVENTFAYTPGQYQYTVGNYTAGTFTGNLTSGSAVITNVTIPANLTLVGDISDLNGLVPSGTTITAIGTNTVTMSAAATASTTGDTFTYTIPGNFKMQRPLRVTQAFTRITTSGSSLDYPIDIISRDQYTHIGYKALPGPWPVVCYYDPTFPLGNLYFYQNPSQAGVLHLWTDTILADLTTLNQTISLPQGYARAIKKNLALELAPEYGKTAGALLVKQALEAKDMIRNLNHKPQEVSRFDRDLIRSNQRVDAGWIIGGGFI